MSVKPSAPSSSLATYCGATQMLGSFRMRTVVVSGPPSAASTYGVRRRAVPQASDRVVRKRRRVGVIGIGRLLPLSWHSRLQLAFELVEKAPIGAVGDDLLRGGLDEPGVPHAQRVEPNRVLRVVFPPSVVGNVP